MENLNKIEETKEVEFIKDSRIALKNEVRDFKEGTKHKFEKDTADKLVSQKVAKYIDEIIDSNTKNKSTKESNVKSIKIKNSEDSESGK